MTKLYTVLYIFICTLVSCAERDTSVDNYNSANNPVINNPVQNTYLPDSSKNKTINFQPGNASQNISTVPGANKINFNPQGGTGNLNPAHGLPGHRCDIAVGAPLNNSPVQTTQGTPSINPVQAPINANTQPALQKPATQNPATQNPATQNVVAAGMNPAHGKPGHRCDIAVGAPLNSKPDQKSSSTPAITTTTSSATKTEPAAQKVAPGMNPAHGQPGHRCDIAVGAPLNSKPVQNVSGDQPAITPVITTPVKADTAKK